MALSVDNNHNLQPKSYFHATYSAGSISEKDSLVGKSVFLKCKAATYQLMIVTACSHRVTSILLKPLEVSVKAKLVDSNLDLMLKRANSMQHILLKVLAATQLVFMLLEVSVKVTHWLTRVKLGMEACSSLEA